MATTSFFDIYKNWLNSPANTNPSLKDLLSQGAPNTYGWSVANNPGIMEMAQWQRQQERQPAIVKNVRASMGMPLEGPDPRAPLTQMAGPAQQPVQAKPLTQLTAPTTMGMKRSRGMFF